MSELLRIHSESMKKMCKLVVCFVLQGSGSRHLHDQFPGGVPVRGCQLRGQRPGGGEPETAGEDPAGQELHESFQSCNKSRLK